jgi:AcrR family transcriptional regulator
MNAASNSPRAVWPTPGSTALQSTRGVNKQLAYHYFGGKDDLYVATLEFIYADIRAREPELHLAELAPREQWPS